MDRSIITVTGLNKVGIIGDSLSVGGMNSIGSRVEEIVMNELVYC